jgi:hypothetical protein
LDGKEFALADRLPPPPLWVFPGVAKKPRSSSFKFQEERYWWDYLQKNGFYQKLQRAFSSPYSFSLGSSDVHIHLFKPPILPKTVWTPPSNPIFPPQRWQNNLGQGNSLFGSLLPSSPKREGSFPVWRSSFRVPRGASNPSFV